MKMKHHVERDVLSAAPTLYLHVCVENVPIVAGSVIIHSGTDTVIDLGDGRLSGEHSRGRVSYKTGEICLYFSIPTKSEIVASYDVWLGEVK